MPAIPEDVGPAMRAAEVETWQSDAIRSRYPSAADGLAEPAEGFFQNRADAAAAIAARGALLGTERRRFAVIAYGLLWPASPPQLATATLIDEAQAVNAPMLVTRIEIDLNSETTTLGLWG